MRSFIFLSHSGCLLPSLIILNLFFGRLIFNTRTWLISEAVLLLLFLLHTYMVSRKVFSGFMQKHPDAIDVEGRVVEEKRRKV